MRIISGINKGRSLVSLGKGDPSANLRPTSDRVRESIFNLLAAGRFGNRLENCRILDLFAGTGALGLEALSRGATSVVFVDNGAHALQLLRKNIAICNAKNITQVVKTDATKTLPKYQKVILIQSLLIHPTEKGWGKRLCKTLESAKCYVQIH